MAALAAWIIAAISAGGYAGVAALMALESACTPLPSEIIMPFAGYLASTGRFTLWGAALAGAIGCNIGSAVAYFAGSRGGRPFVARYGRYVLADVGDLDRAERFFARFGAFAVLIGRLLPVVRTFIALPAGVGRMKLLPFHALTFVGSFVWCYALAAIGEALGEKWQSDPRVGGLLHKFDAVVIVCVLAAAAAFVWLKLRRRAPAAPPT